MFQRHRLEKEEGKAYNDPGVCEILNLSYGDRTEFLSRSLGR